MQLHEWKWVHTSGNQILCTELKMRRRLFDRKRGTQPGEQVSARKGRQYSSRTPRWWKLIGMRFSGVQWERGCTRNWEKRARRKAEWNSGKRGKIDWNCQAKEMHSLFYFCGFHSPHPSSDRDGSCSRTFSNQLYVCTGPWPLDIEKKKLKKKISNRRWNRIPENRKKRRRLNYNQHKLKLLC